MNKAASIVSLAVSLLGAPGASAILIEWRYTLETDLQLIGGTIQPYPAVGSAVMSGSFEGDVVDGVIQNLSFVSWSNYPDLASASISGSIPVDGSLQGLEFSVSGVADQYRPVRFDLSTNARWMYESGDFFWENSANSSWSIQPVPEAGDTAVLLTGSLGGLLFLVAVPGFRREAGVW